MLTYIIFIIIALYLWGFYIEPNLLVVKKYNVRNFNGKRIVFVSDFHIGKHDKHRLIRIVNKINKLNPDFVLSGGDFIKGHSGKHSLSLKEIAKILKNIQAPFITVLGNHDSNYDKFTVKKALEEVGITVLNNTSILIDDIYISGVGNKRVSPSEILAALEHTDSKRILISHTPDIYYDVKDNVDLILAGHVHGGQVRLPFIGALICPSKYGTKFSGGDYKETQNRMIVTRGLGTSLLSVRFCDIPEIVLLEEYK